MIKSKTRAFKWDHNYTDRMNFLQGVYNRSLLNEDSVISINWVPLTDNAGFYWSPSTQILHVEKNKYDYDKEQNQSFQMRP